MSDATHRPAAWQQYLDKAGPLPDEMVIAGARRAASGGERIVSFDPAVGSPLVEVPDATAADVDEAVAAARRALTGHWRSMKPAERGRMLASVAALIRRDGERLALIETLDSGKPLREARGDIETSARYFEYYAGIVDKLGGTTIPLGRDYLSATILEPVGVTAHIIPWNFPLVTTARGVAPALAAGCTVVVKPAEQTPLTAILLADLLTEAGLPTGVYNVVTGSGAIAGDALARHPDVDHVTFTGSVHTGKAVMKSAAEHVASVTLELGGKSPVIVLGDANIDSAVAGALKGIMLNAGQVCSAGSRLVVERQVADEMTGRIAKAMQALEFGHGAADPGVGPIVSPAQLARINRMVEEARSEGAEVLTGGHVERVAAFPDGWYFQPTIIRASSGKEAIVRDEVFGPVLTVQVVDDAPAALEAANATDFGLVAGIYTRDIAKALRLARDVSAGQVFINEYFAGGVETPFGGNKQSGFGREKGLEALRNYTRVKCVTMRM